VAKPNRTLALLAYLIPVVGPLIVLVVGRKNPFATYHACQALGLAAVAICAPVAWGLAALAVAWLPIVGPVLSVSSFALVIAAYVAVAIAWLGGLLNAARQKLEPVPLLSGWGNWIFQQLTSTLVEPVV